MKLSDKAVKIAGEVDEMKEFYQKSQLFSGIINVNAVGWLIAGLGFFFVGVTVLTIACFAIASINIFTIVYSRQRKKND